MNDPNMHLSWIRMCLLNKRPFIHLRFNDGESNNMFGLLPATSTTSGEHHHFRDLGKEMRKTFKEVCKEAAFRNEERNIILGSYWEHELSKPWAQCLREFIYDEGFEGIKWTSSDFWYSTELEVKGECCKTITTLLDTIRFAAIDGRKVVLVANYKLRDASYCLSAELLEIPAQDAWLKNSEIWLKLKSKQYDDAIFVWCAGLPGKVWAWRTYCRHTRSSHIDAGHFFDGLGTPNRAWMNRPEGVHKDYYYGTLIPYIKGFIP